VAKDGKIFALCFQQIKRAKVPIDTGTVSVTMLPTPLDAKHEDILRYEYIVDSIVDWLCALIPQAERVGANIYCEGYVYGMKSAHSFKLHEITGILKFMLMKAGFTNMTTIPVTSWKKALTSNAFADKYEVLQAVNKQIGVDLVDIFQTTLGAEKIVKQKRKRKRPSTTPKLTKSVPCPLQDVSDAMGIILPFLKRQKK